MMPGSNGRARVRWCRRCGYAPLGPYPMRVDPPGMVCADEDLCDDRRLADEHRRLQREYDDGRALERWRARERR